MKEAKAEF